MFMAVPTVAQGKQIRLGSMRLHVRSLASVSGLGIRRCRELGCRLQTRLGSGVAVAVVQASGYSSDWTPSLGTSMCHKCSPRKDKKTKKERFTCSLFSIAALLFHPHLLPLVTLGNLGTWHGFKDRDINFFISTGQRLNGRLFVCMVQEM